jgi:DNA-binding beta-propeller fold protein YncE
MDGVSSACPQNFAKQHASLAIAAALTVLLSFSAAVPAQTIADSTPIQLEAKISLGPVRGRIDHMAFDVARRRLFLAELGNDSVGVVDVDAGKTIHTIDGLAEPQGVGYVPSTDTIYVANARDGSVRLFHGADYAPVGRIDLGSDADNVRLDAEAGRILVGYGGGAIAAIDVGQHKKFGDVALPAHPESFQIASTSNKVFVNVPGARAIAVLNGFTGSKTDIWQVREGGNFPMALDKANNRVLIVSRSPPKLSVRSSDDGAVVATVETCGDSDDLFVDAKRDRVYVSCGAGFIDVLEAGGTHYNRSARIPTMAGARTSLFVPELDRLYLAVRAGNSAEAAIWVFRPTP